MGFYPSTPSQGLEIPRRYTALVDGAFDRTIPSTAAAAPAAAGPRRATTLLGHGDRGAPPAPRPLMSTLRRQMDADAFEYADLIRRQV